MEVITVCDTDIAVKEWKGKRVVSLVDIDRVHKRTRGTARRNFYQNKSKFVENTDFFNLSTDEFRPLNDNPRYNYPRGAYILTESGYLMLVKTLNDDVAWKVQRELVNVYFKNKPVTSVPVPIQQHEPVSNSLSTFEKFLDVQVKMIEMERENNSALREENAELREMIKNLIGLVTKQQNLPKDIQPVNEGNPSYTDFKRNINKAVDEIIAFHHPKYKDKNAILHEAYDRIRKEYGIVYEQEKKSFLNDMDRGPVSTLELQWYVESVNPACKNLLICKLNNIYNEVRK